MSAPIKVDLYVSPYCPHCEAMLATLAVLTAVRGRRVSIHKRDVLQHLESAVAAGVRATPALVMDGQLLASGRLTPKRLRKILQDALAGELNDGAHDR